MDPFTLALLAVGTGLNATGKLMGGVSSKALSGLQGDAYDAQFSTAQTNTDLLNTQADIAGMGVEFAASKEKQQLGAIAEAGRKTLSAQRSYFAGNHLDPTFGSPLLAQALTAGRITSDIDLAKASFAVDKANSLSNEATIRAQAAGSAGQALSALYGKMGAQMKGNSDLTAGFIGAGTALLSGASSMAGGGAFGGSGGNVGTISVGSQSFPAFR